MAYANNTRATFDGLKLDLSAAILHLIQRATDYRAYRQTISELSGLTNRELADLGISRSGIRAEAHKAVYGTHA